MLLHFNRFPRVVDVITVNPEFRYLFRVELSAHDWVVFRLHGGDEGSAIVIFTGSRNVPEGVKSLIFDDPAWSERPLVTIVGQVFL